MPMLIPESSLHACQDSGVLVQGLSFAGKDIYLTCSFPTEPLLEDYQILLVAVGVNPGFYIAATFASSLGEFLQSKIKSLESVFAPISNPTLNGGPLD